jgi:hypoxanthine-DNA glycosylase
MYKKALSPLVENSSKILILGTMPGEQSIAKQQYYGNPGNQFWKILFSIFNEDFSLSYEDRKALVRKHKIALWNVLSSCLRQGSSDAKITDEKANDLGSFLKQYPNIKHIFFESKTAFRYFEKYNIPLKNITYMTLPSTSGLNAGLSKDAKTESWKIVAETARLYTDTN